MAWFKKKKTADDIDEEVKAITSLCVEAIRRTWVDLQHHSATPEALAGEIEEFSQSAFRFMFTKFPLTKQAPPFYLWLTLFNAVLESKTYPTEQVNKAIDLLRAKYAN